MAVGAALKSFLTSHPYKNIKCLRYICHVNGLPIEGTVDVLRKYICDYANDNNVDPEAIKITAQEFQENPDECIAKTKSFVGSKRTHTQFEIYLLRGRDWRVQ